MEFLPPSGNNTASVNLAPNLPNLLFGSFLITLGSAACTSALRCASARERAIFCCCSARSSSNLACCSAFLFSFSACAILFVSSNHAGQGQEMQKLRVRTYIFRSSFCIFLLVILPIPLTPVEPLDTLIASLLTMLGS